MENDLDLPDNSPAPRGVGAELRAAREAQGLSLRDIAVRTRVGERHLASIEADRFEDLAAPTYAVGFSRSYAKAVGLDQADVVARVRQKLALNPAVRPDLSPTFEPGDPARIPPSKIAWFAGLCAVVVVGLLVVYWTNFLSPEGKLPSLLPDETHTEAAASLASEAAPSDAPASPAPANGPIILTANGPKVWVRVTDGNGNRLLERELTQGESWTVPAEAQSPQLRTGRPDQLQITVGGQAIAPLSVKPQVLSGVLLTPAGLAERASAAAAAQVASQPTNAAAASPTSGHALTRVRGTPSPSSDAMSSVGQPAGQPAASVQHSTVSTTMDPS